MGNSVLTIPMGLALSKSIIKAAPESHASLQGWGGLTHFSS